MKKSFFFLVGTIFISVAMSSCKKTECLPAGQDGWQKTDLKTGHPWEMGWRKIDIDYTWDLKKILYRDGTTIIFGQTACLVSRNLIDWEERQLPDRYLTPSYSDGPFPVLFQGKIYIEGKDGLYCSNDDGRSWTRVFQAMIEVVAADENWLYIFQAYGSYRSPDGISFEPLVGLDSIIHPIPRNPNIYLTFGKASGGKITLAGIWNTGMEYQFTSCNFGITWEFSTSLLVNDVILDEKVYSNHSGLYFIADGTIEINQIGGIFNSVEKFGRGDGDYYFAGKTNWCYPDSTKQNVNFVMKNNFKNIIIFDEEIQDLEVIGGGRNLMAVGDEGSVYIL